MNHSESIEQKDSLKITKLRVSSNVMFQILSHVDLWYPEILNPVCLPLLTDPLVDVDKSDLRRSFILEKKAVKELHLTLPSNVQSSKWNRIYSTDLDGYSLQNFYRKVASSASDPVLLIIENFDGDIFGAFLTCAPCLTEEFVGTGESWLFLLDQKEKRILKYEWSGENEYFFQGKPNCLVVGACDGKFGIYIDGNIHHGRVDQCATFRNWPWQIKDFGVKFFECFNFSSVDTY